MEGARPSLNFSSALLKMKRAIKIDNEEKEYIAFSDGVKITPIQVVSLEQDGFIGLAFGDTTEIPIFFPPMPICRVSVELENLMRDVALKTKNKKEGDTTVGLRKLPKIN